jgi:pSer/pThr/pTyr-binding forkhead associated (FHA) protein
MPMAHLALRNGPLDGSVFAIPDGNLLIGRAIDCHVKLDDPRVSRHHCVLTFDGRILVLRDLGSQNGTFVNNRPVAMCQTILRDGDLFSVAETIFQVHLASS